MGYDLAKLADLLDSIYLCDIERIERDNSNILLTLNTSDILTKLNIEEIKIKLFSVKEFYVRPFKDKTLERMITDWKEINNMGLRFNEVGMNAIRQFKETKILCLSFDTVKSPYYSKESPLLATDYDLYISANGFHLYDSDMKLMELDLVIKCASEYYKSEE